MISDTVAFKVDFNNREHDHVLASLRYASSARVPDVGDRVELYDDEGNACQGIVAGVSGRIVEVAPDWRTWRTTAVVGEAGFRPAWDTDSRAPVTGGGITTELTPA